MTSKSPSGSFCKRGRAPPIPITLDLSPPSPRPLSKQLQSRYRQIRSQAMSRGGKLAPEVNRYVAHIRVEDEVMKESC
jgi:hypothetical protein